MKNAVDRVKKFRDSEEGSAIVIIALSFTVLLLMAAIVIDFGLAYSRTGEIQNASDAAVLAAAQLLPVDVTDTFGIIEIKEKAVEYAHKNGILDATVENVILSGETNGAYTKIQMLLSQEVSTVFSKVIGVQFFSISRDSIAKIAPSQRMKGVVPLAVKKSVIEEHIANGEITNITLKFGGGSSTTGDFGVIDLDGVQGGGASDISLWLEYGYTMDISAGEDLLRVEPGNMAGPVNTAVQNRYDSCTHFVGDGGCNVNHFETDCPRVLTIPVVDYVSSKNLKITGFLAFVLEPVTESGFVFGSLIKLTIPGVASNTLEVGDLKDYGLYNVILSK